jgi:TRAP-type mannitol/chloroaromatic compound transport system permease small subunit
MQSLLALSRGIDAITEKLGRALCWLLLAAVVISTVNAITRKAFNLSSNAYLEAQWYLFAVTFMLGAGYVFLHDQHVRIDVLSSKLKRKTQIKIDVAGIVFFLLPLCVFVVWTSLPSVMTAIQTKEVSASPGGLIRWPLYMLVPVGFSLLAIQSLSELFKRVAFLTGHGPDPHAKPEKTEEQKLAEELQHELEMDADVNSSAPSANASGSAAAPTRNTP